MARRSGTNTQPFFLAFWEHLTHVFTMMYRTSYSHVHTFRSSKKRKATTDSEGCIDVEHIIQNGMELGQTIVMRGRYNGKFVIVKVMGFRKQTGSLTPEEEIKFTRKVGLGGYGPKVLDVWQKQAVDQEFFGGPIEISGKQLSDGVKLIKTTESDDDRDDEWGLHSLMILEDLKSEGFEDVEEMTFGNIDDAKGLADKIATQHSNMCKETNISHGDLSPRLRQAASPSAFDVQVPEWSKGTRSSRVVVRCVGSNPTLHKTAHFADTDVAKRVTEKETDLEKIAAMTCPNDPSKGALCHSLSYHAKTTR